MCGAYDSLQKAVKVISDIYLERLTSSTYPMYFRERWLSPYSYFKEGIYKIYKLELNKTTHNLKPITLVDIQNALKEVYKQEREE